MNDFSFPNQKIGLVLSGGGALGAYQVGLIRALAELNINIDVVSGASIGALNGGIVASSPSIEESAKRLEDLWGSFEKKSPLEVNHFFYLRMLVAAGLRSNGVSSLISVLSALPSEFIPQKIKSKLSILDNDGLFKDDPLRCLMKDYLDVEHLSRGLPLYVSLYETENVIADIVGIIGSELGIQHNKESEIVHVQSLLPEEQRAALLGSAALPLLFKPKEVGGKQYSDGGAGGWRKSQGNTPVQPLIDAGCNVIIVSHLAEGSLWSRHDFNESKVTFIEVRPSQSLARHEGLTGGVKDLLGFDSKYIGSIKEQGYLDTKDTLESILEPIKAKIHLAASELTIDESFKNSNVIDSELDDVMSKL